MLTFEVLGILHGILNHVTGVDREFLWRFGRPTVDRRYGELDSAEAYAHFAVLTDSRNTLVGASAASGLVSRRARFVARGEAAGIHGTGSKEGRLF